MTCARNWANWTRRPRPSRPAQAPASDSFQAGACSRSVGFRLEPPRAGEVPRLWTFPASAPRSTLAQARPSCAVLAALDGSPIRRLWCALCASPVRAPRSRAGACSGRLWHPRRPRADPVRARVRGAPPVVALVHRNRNRAPRLWCALFPVRLFPPHFQETLPKTKHEAKPTETRSPILLRN